MKDEIINGKSSKNKKIGRTISNILELPEDTLLGLPRITMQGTDNILIENHRGIIEYTNNKIIANTCLKPIVVCGKRLIIKNIGKDNIYIEGYIRSFEFLDRKENA